MKKKVWIISEFYYPIVTSTGFYMTEIAEYLVSRGMDVHVLCTGAKYNETGNYQLKKFEIHNGVNIHRVLMAEIDKNNFVKRIFRLLLSSIYLFFKALKNVKKEDELLVVTNPAFLLVFMPVVAFLKDVPYKLLIHDIFPENLVAIKKMNASSWNYKFLKGIFDRAYASAQVCISIGRDMTEVIRNKTKGKVRIDLIPNWADNKEVFPLDKRETQLYKQLQISDFVFQFAGNLGHAQGIDNILSAISLVKNEVISFLFVGGGAKSEMVKDFSKRKNNVFYIGFQERSMQNDFLNACDIAIVTLNDGMYGLGVPSKSYNIMAAGKPILYVGDEKSEIALCIRKYNLGWLVKPNDPYDLKNMIEYIYNNRDNLISIQNNARRVADTIFAKEKILNKYYNLLN